MKLAAEKPARYGWAQLREAFIKGAITLSDHFEDEHTRTHAIALRSVLFLDGDVVCTIDARALERADFAERLALHHARVHAAFHGFHSAAQRYLKWLPRLLGLLGPGSYAGLRSSGDLPTREMVAMLGGYLSPVYVEVLNLALSCLLGVAITQIFHNHIARRLWSAVGRRTIYRRS